MVLFIYSYSCARKRFNNYYRNTTEKGESPMFIEEMHFQLYLNSVRETADHLHHKSLVKPLCLSFGKWGLICYHRCILQHDPGTDQRLTCDSLPNTTCQIINWPLCFVNNALISRTAPSLLKTSYHLLLFRKLQP